MLQQPRFIAQLQVISMSVQLITWNGKHEGHITASPAVGLLDNSLAVLDSVTEGMRPTQAQHTCSKDGLPSSESSLYASLSKANDCGDADDVWRPHLPAGEITAEPKPHQAREQEAESQDSEDERTPDIMQDEQMSKYVDGRLQLGCAVVESTPSRSHIGTNGVQHALDCNTLERDIQQDPSVGTDSAGLEVNSGVIRRDAGLANQTFSSHSPLKTKLSAVEAVALASRNKLSSVAAHVRRPSRSCLQHIPAGIPAVVTLESAPHEISLSSWYLYCA
jgi:hypothetical protein